MKINEIVFFVRKQMDLDQKEFGELFGNSPAAVSLWESGKRLPKADVIEFCINKKTGVKLCPMCNGRGVLNAT